MAALKVLIIGGYGTFGGRLVRLLMDEADLHIVVAGRSSAQAEQFATRTSGRATVTAARLDRQGDLESTYAAIAPDLVIDASGPFQAYGDDPYRVVRAALAAGASYLDLADDADFVLGITDLDHDAKRAGRYALSGVSTCPALTGAIYRRITRDFGEVQSVTGGIAPSPYAGVGPSVIRAIASYAGKGITVLTNGKCATGYSFIDTRRFTVAPAGGVPLRSLKFSLVDVPDLRLLGQIEPTPASVWFGAAPVPTLYHAAFRLLARVVRRGFVSTLAPLAPVMHFVMQHFSWGEHRGGMFLECAGRDPAGLPRRRSWHLVAEGSIGPLTPTLACVAIVRAALAGAPPAPGARPAHAALELEDFEPLLARLGCVTSERELPSPSGWPLFRRLLGSAWRSLPQGIAKAHECTDRITLRGRATIVRGRSLVARAVAWICGFPLSAEHVPVTVEMLARDGEEVWRRDFDGHRFTSVLSEGSGAWSSLLVERFGPFRFGIALVLEDDKLRYVVRRWSFAGLPMPAALRPRGTTFESLEDRRFRFDVEIRLPLVGHVVTYRGWLAAQ